MGGWNHLGCHPCLGSSPMAMAARGSSCGHDSGDSVGSRESRRECQHCVGKDNATRSGMRTWRGQKGISERGSLVKSGLRCRIGTNIHGKHGYSCGRRLSVASCFPGCGYLPALSEMRARYARQVQPARGLLALDRYLISMNGRCSHEVLLQVVILEDSEEGVSGWLLYLIHTSLPSQYLPMLEARERHRKGRAAKTSHHKSSTIAPRIIKASKAYCHGCST